MTMLPLAHRIFHLSTRSALVAAVALIGCAGAPPPQPRAPTDIAPPTPQAPANTDPFRVEGKLAEEWLPLLEPAAAKYKRLELGPLPTGVVEAPPSCRSWTDRKPPVYAQCKTSDVALEALKTALGKTAPAERDSALSALEKCEGLAPGVVRALRIEFAPIQCGDAMAEPLVKTAVEGMPGPIYHALIGHALAARYERAVSNPPFLSKPHSRERVLAFLKGQLVEWVQGQAKAIDALTEVAKDLPYYGKGIAAVSAGLSEMRLVEVFRDAPIPKEIESDPELKNAYFAALDEQLEPRKRRGRDAALVGLKELSYVGVLHDRRVADARRLLSTLYGGRRVDALDNLILPPIDAPEPQTTTEALAAVLPAFYAGMLIPAEEAKKPEVLVQLVKQGLSIPHRRMLKENEIAPDRIAPEMHFRLELGQTYWRSVDFDRAVALATSWPKETERPDEVTLLFATALALRGGPEDAADLMNKAPTVPAGIGFVEALDAVATEQDAWAGPAALNAAMIREVGVPMNADAAYFKELQQRYLGASKLLTDPEAQSLATERAEAAGATAAELSQ